MLGWIFRFLCLAALLSAHEKYKHVIFDLGQVMVEWDPLRMVEETFSKEERIPYELTHVFSTQLWYDYDGGISREELLERLPSNCDRQLFDRLTSQIPQLLPLIPEMTSLAKEVKALGYKIYMLSNMPREVFEGLDARYGLSSLFDGKIISCYAGSIKPAPQIYHALLSAYSLNPSECLFIDDREENIRGGNQCGIDGIVFKGPIPLRASLKELDIIK